jgi:hypothetical protein
MGEVYEIKPEADARTAASEVQWYIDQLKVAYPAIDWKPGALISPSPSYYPMGQFVHPLLIGKAVRVRLSGLGDGVIVYSIEDGPTSRLLPISVFVTVGIAVLIAQIGIAALARI